MLRIGDDFPIVKPAVRTPFEYAAKARIKAARPGSKRAKLVELLGRPKGATFEQVMAACEWDRKTA